ncbi:hypothetical protein HD806DRAFT_213124 [Xylariaceae sp. AK1471]|nr:hypothetical protein HD806DRAFT_213124 [Xylariaceae sp. AK1471]
MAAQQDLQDLIRLMTVGMKVSMKDALSRVKSLQIKNLRSVQQIAECPLSEVQSALSDAKAARSLQNACKARMKNSTVPSASKRSGSDLTANTKRLKSSNDTGYLAGQDLVDPRDYEASLELPVETDEEVVANAILVTNRAPLVLAFAVELLRYTMPEQPPSSRLSLAQAVVSANSRSKAVSMGLEKGLSADDEGWGHGQPRVRVMGREVAVLKRSGYEWKGEEEVREASNPPDNLKAPSSASETGISQDRGSHTARSWSTSQPITLKQSTFVVRATALTDPSQRQSVLQSLFATIPTLQTATHNAWAYRVKVPTHLFNATTIKEESFDDGESGCGSFLLKNMQEMNAIDTLVVMTRWYGGIMLGPDRWRIMRNCLRDALSERLRVTGEQATLGGEAVWGLDLEAMKNKVGSAGSASSRSYEAGVIGMPIHRPEAAKAYLFKSFATRIEAAKDEEGSRGPNTNDEQDAPPPRKASTSKATPKRKTAKAMELEKEENVARLIGAIRLLYESWADHLSASDLDRRAWNWYVAVRPDVEGGPSGWGAKGQLKLSDILALRRKEV